MNPFFTIIVPVYNVEKYLNECVDSVINQTFTNWELLLVDDGSSDRSSLICDEYAKTDERVSVFHKKNGGASDSRNFGLDRANGEYVLFLDSDDYWNDLNMLYILYEKISETDSDIVIFGCTDFDTRTGESYVSRTAYNTQLIDAGNYSKTLHYLLSSKMIPGAAWLFVFRKEIYKKIKYKFHLGIQNEDFDFVLSMFLNAKRVSAVNNPFYMYRKGRNESVTRISNIKMIYGIDYTLNKWISIASEIEDELIKKDVLNYLAFIYTTGFVILGRLPKQQTNEAITVMKKHKNIMKFGYWEKTKTIKIADAVFGDRLFSKLAVIYYRHTHMGV